MPTSQHREPPSPKPAHLPANTTQTAAKTLPSAPIQPHDPPDALLELAEMRGNEREIDLSVLSPRNYKWVRVRIVEAHGGRIRVESEGPGLGTRFTFTVPVADGAEDATRRVPAASARSRGTSRIKLRILAVDDDPQALRYVRDAISKAGYAPIVTGDPEDVPRLMEEEKPHLALLDLMLPGSDGIELMTGILRSADVPVIFVSVYGQEDVVARAFDIGASDYAVKPFSPTELAARNRAALHRRAGSDSVEPPGPYQLEDQSIDYAQRRVRLEGRTVELTPTEYGLLYELSVHAGRVLTHDHRLQRAWGPERIGERWLVREVVKRLRGKLGDTAGSPSYIFTEPRVGYRMFNGAGDHHA